MLIAAVGATDPAIDVAGCAGLIAAADVVAADAKPAVINAEITDFSFTAQAISAKAFAAVISAGVAILEGRAFAVTATALTRREYLAAVHAFGTDALCGA